MSLAERTDVRPDTHHVAPPLVEVANLTVRFGPRHRPTTVVEGVSFTVGRGEAVALVGESGSGKSVTARTLVGLTGAGATVTADRLRFDGEDVLRLPERRWRRIRGARIGFVLQDALASLDALRRVGQEVGEPLKLHTDLTARERERKVLELLTLVGIPEPELRARQYPHELSGGLRQRALIASALAAGPSFLIADEPTTALDTTVQAQILDLLRSLKTRDTGMLVVSHDLSVVAQIADRVLVMRHGRIVEQGSVDAVLGDPQHPYTKNLLAAVPSAASKGSRLSPTPPVRLTHPTRPRPDGPIVEADGLTKVFTGPDHRRRTVVSAVSFTLHAGQTLGIVGESGSGKTTTARMVLGVETPDEGAVRLLGRSWTELDRVGRRRTHRRVQAIYQDPLSSFDPRFTVGRVIDEALGAIGVRRGRERRHRAVELLEWVRLGEDYLDRRPIELSGGERQRVAIARALAAEPDVIVCDEPVSALDVSVQAQVLDLLVDIQRQLGIAYFFISHDLGVVHHIADHVLVMKDGVVVESGDVDTVFREPRHPYTKALLEAIPRLDTAGVRRHG